MFIDEVKISVTAWKWWDWVVTWRREKYIPKWWPRWWNGWNGWNVYIQTTSNLNTLSEFRNKKVLKAQDWQKWWTNLMKWATWEDLIIFVPVWTIVKDSDTWETIVDLSENNLKYLLASWWRWWYGNAHFVSSTRQAPWFAELWDIWESKNISLELKLVADIWIIWIPSAWKSSLVWTITNVKPKIWDYPFTTITPNLWVLEHKGKTLVIEDVPWLIPWASQWKWLWIEFLRHIERTKVLLHLLDLYRLDNVIQDYENIRYELWAFSDLLKDKEEIVVFSKWDLLDDEMKEFIKKEFLSKYKKDKVFIISSATWEWIKELKDFLIDNYTTSLSYNDEIKFLNQSDLKIIDLKEEDDPREVNLEYIWDYRFVASWKRLNQIVRMTDFSNPEWVARVIDVLDKLGITRKIQSKTEAILRENDINNDFFFEWNDDNWFEVVVNIAWKDIPLDKLKFNL